MNPNCFFSPYIDCLKWWVKEKAEYLLRTRSMEEITSKKYIRKILSQEISYQFNKVAEKDRKRITYVSMESFISNLN